MYNNFSSKKTKKVISALLATALVATSAPISADAATTKTVGVGKTITYNAKATVKKVTVKNKKIVTAKKSGKKVTIKGKKAGKTTVTVKTTKKTIKLTVKVGATKIAKKTVTTSMKVGETKALKVTATNGKGDTIKFTSSNKATVKVNKASAVANSKKVAGTTVTALKAGTAKITATSKYTGKKKTFTITVVDATPTVTPSTNPAIVATTPAVTNTTTPGTNPGGSTSTTTKAPTTTSGAATNAPGTSANPDETKDPNATGTPGESNAPGATDDANTTPTPEVTNIPEVTNTPEVTTTPAITTEPAATATPSAIEFTAKQTGDKKIKITNPTAMTKSDISIKRGSSALTINNVTFNSDATEAEVTLAGSIIAVDYTITVGEKTYTLKGEASEVADIQITSDYAPIKGNIGSDTVGESDTAIATYAVYNQFGENVTAKTSLTANTSAKDATLNPIDGTITITWDADPRLNDVVSVVLMHQATGLSATKILTVQSKSAPSEVEVYGLYNVDGKTLTATNAKKESFYFLYRVKDQYGNYMNNVVDKSSAGDVQNLFTTVSSGMTNITLDTDNRQTVTVDGVNYFGYPVELSDTSKAVTAGKVTVMLIPGGSGKTVTTEFTVEAGSTVKTFNVIVDSSVASGGEKVLSYVALDENGDEVTDYRVLNEVKSSSKKFYWRKANGTVELVFDDSKDNKAPATGTSAGSTISTVFTLPSYETVLVNVNVGEASVPASISGISSDVALAARNSEAITISFEDLSILDQYGNDADTTNFIANAANATTGDDGKLGVMLVEEDSNNANFETTASTLKYKDSTTANIIGTGDDFTITANDDDKLGSESFTFKLVKYDEVGGKWVDYESNYTTSAKVNFTQTGAFTTTLVVTTDKNFASYDVNTIDALYDNGSTADVTEYEGTVEVYGVLNNGMKVKLAAGTDYNIVPGNNVLAGTKDDNIKADEVTYPAGATSVQGSYDIVINYNGETINKKVTVSNVAPTTAEIKAKSGEKFDFSAATYFGTAGVSATFINTLLTSKLEAKDSYGVATTIGTGTESTTKAGGNEDVIITVTDIDSDNGTVTGNGTTAPKFADFEAGDSFTVTFTAGTASYTTVVSIQE